MTMREGFRRATGHEVLNDPNPGRSLSGALGGEGHLQAVLLLPRLSCSIHYNACLQRVGGASFLCWWVERFAARHKGVALTVVCVTEHQASEARRELSPSSAQVTFVKAGTTLRALASVAAVLPDSDIAVLPLGFAFGPPDLLARSYAHHMRSANDCTLVSGLPRGAVPEIYAAGLLVRLCKLALPGLPTNPAAAVDLLLRASANAGGEPVLPIRATRFDAGGVYPIVPQELPEQVDLAVPGDVRIARRVIKHDHKTDESLDELRRWRQVSLAIRLAMEKRVNRLTPRRLSAALRRSSTRRILFVSRPSAFSGSEQSLVQIASKIDQKRFRPFCLVGAEGLLARRLRRAGVAVTLSGTSGRDEIEEVLFLAGLIKEINPHILHLNGPLGPVPIPVRALWGVPLVTHVHTADVRRHATQLKWSDALVVVSHFVRREVLKLEIPNSRVQTVYNGVDVELFRENSSAKLRVRRKLGIPDDAKVVMMTARFTPMKRHDLLLKAVRMAKARLPELFVLLNGEVFGESAVYDSVQDTIRGQLMEGWVRMIPFVEDTRDLYSVADLLVLCSEREAMGICVVESMAMGVPVIVTNSGGLPELVRHGKTGFIVPPGEVKPLAEQIVGIFDMHQTLTLITRAARLQVERRFDASRTACRVMDLYEELLQS